MKKKGDEFSEEDVKKMGADLLTDNEVKFEVSVNKPTILHKFDLLPKKRIFCVKPMVLATMVQIAKLLSGVKLEPEGLKHLDNAEFFSYALNAIRENDSLIPKAIALAIKNDGKSYNKKLARFLNRNLSSKEAHEVFSIIANKMDVSFFLLTLALIQGVDVMKTEKATEKETSGEQSEA